MIGDAVTIYVQNPGTYYAALWDGVDSGPLDAMMTQLYGDDYLGSEILGSTLILRGQGDLYFFGGNQSLEIPSGQVLHRGPYYGQYSGQAAWGFLPQAAFTARFGATQ